MTYLMDDPREGGRLRAKTDEEQLAEQFRSVPLRPGQRVLEVGCGSGAVARWLARRVAPGEVVGLDLSEERLEEARRASTEEGISNVRFVHGEATETGLAAASFDVAVSRFLFEYLPEPLAALREMRRLVRPGGWLAVVDLDENMVGHHPLEASLARGIDEIMAALRERRLFDPHVGRKLFHLFHEAGLDEIRVDIQPYHQIFGSISEQDERLWKLKLDIASETLRRLDPALWEARRHVFDALMEHLRRPDTATFSIAFVVCGRVPEEPGG